MRYRVAKHNARKQRSVNESYANIPRFSFVSHTLRKLGFMINKRETIVIQDHGVTEEYIHKT